MYFLLTKPFKKDIGDDTDNQIVSFHSNTYILPRNNLRYYVDHGLFEKHLIDWSKQFCDSSKVFLDIGAHTGTYSVTLAHCCKHVYAFEPQRMTYYALCGSVALSGIQNITCLNTGLGSKEQVGKQTLNIVSLDGGGSTLHLKDNQVQLSTETIHIQTLDSLELSDIGFIKMDVEENELYVLQGAEQTLRKMKPTLMFESNHHNQPLFDYIQSLGYSVVPIARVSNMFLAR